ncbi:MAG: acyltransferase [Terriglobales bacterium]
MSAAPAAIVGRKLQSLDGLRALAIILVFFHHMQSDHFPVLNRPTFFIKAYIAQGWIGVDLFFVLSGFLITGILLHTREPSNYFTGFYARRVLRIFPLYYLVLTGIIVTSQILTNAHAQSAPEIAALVPLPEDRWVYFCYLTNWTRLWKAHWDSHFASILAHFWSLAVEEQFYVFWPFIVWIVRPRTIPWVAGIVAGLSAMIRLAWVAHAGLQIVPPQLVEIQLATICRLDALFIGALCACFFRDPKLMLRIHKWLPWIASMGVGSFFLTYSGMLFFPPRNGLSVEDATRVFMLCGGYTLLALGFGALVLLAAYTEIKTTLMQKFLKSRWLAPIGAYSYGIYVFHVPILGVGNVYVFPKIARGASTVRELAFTQCAYIIVLTAVTFAISALSHEFFEKKFLRFKRYFEAKTNTKTNTAPASREIIVDDPAVAQESVVV